MARAIPAPKRKATRIAVDHGTSGTSAAAYYPESGAIELVSVGHNVETSSAFTRLPAQVQITQFEDRIDIDVIGFDDVALLLGKKVGKVIGTRTIAAPKLLLDPARCSTGQARKDVLYLEEVGVSAWDCFRVYMERFLELLEEKIDIDSIETFCLTVPGMHADGDRRGEEMQDGMAREIDLAARHVWREDYCLNEKLDFESEPVAALAHLAISHLQTGDASRPIVVLDAGGSTVDLAAATEKNGALEFIMKAKSASAGTYYLWNDHLRKACASDQDYDYAQNIMKKMKEPEDISQCGIKKEKVVEMLQQTYEPARKVMKKTFLTLKKKKYLPPLVILIGRAPGANQMIQMFLVNMVMCLLRAIFPGQTIPEVKVPEGIDVGVSVCRGAALPYDSYPVEAFEQATMAVCYQADGGKDLPPEVRGKDNALVVIKPGGSDVLSTYHSCHVDGDPKKFAIEPYTILSSQKPHEFVDEGEIFYFYPKRAGLTMNALIIDLTGYAEEGDRIRYRFQCPDSGRPTEYIVEVRCPKGERTQDVELLRDRERIQFRFARRPTVRELPESSLRDDALQGAARAAAREADRDEYSVPESEPSDLGSSSVQHSPRATIKRSGAEAGDPTQREVRQKRRRLPSGTL